MAWVKNNLSKVIRISKMVFSTFSVGNIIPLVAVFRELLEPVYWFGHAYN